MAKLQGGRVTQSLVDFATFNLRFQMRIGASMVPNWLLIVVSVVAGVGGQVSIKWGVSHAPPFKLPFMASLPALFQSPLTLLGLGLYGLGAVSWIAVLKRMDLSHAYPFLALNFVLIALVSGFFLGEAIPPLRWAGLGLICCGIVLVSFGATS